MRKKRVILVVGILCFFALVPLAVFLSPLHQLASFTHFLKGNDSSSPSSTTPPVVQKPDAKSQPEFLTATTPKLNVIDIPYAENGAFNKNLIVGKTLKVGGNVTIAGTTIMEQSLTAPNVIYSVQPGLGIAISSGQNPTITNTDAGSSQAIFKTIVVSGQSNIVANSNADVLTLAAGNNVTLTTDASNKIVTIAANATSSSATDSAWIESAGNTTLVNTSDNVGIGTTTPGAALDVNGNILLQGGGSLDTRAAGSLTLGGATQTALTLGGSQGSTTIAGSSLTITPTSWNATPTFSGLITANAGLTIATGQNFILSSLTNNGGLLYTDGSGHVSQTAVGTSGNCLTSNGGGSPSWSSCGASGPNSPFLSVAGAIQQVNTTQDFLLGGISTASAKFAFINTIGAGVPTASISGTTNSNALSLDGNGNIQTENSNILTIGGNTTGNIQFKPGNNSSNLYLSSNNNIGIGTTSPTNGKLEIDGPFPNAATNYASIYSAPVFSLTADNASSVNSAAYFEGKSTSTANNQGTIVGIRAFGTYSGLSAGTLTNLEGILGQAQTLTSSTGNVTNMYGVNFASQHFGTGTVSSEYGANFLASLRSNGGASDGTVTTAYGVFSTLQNASTLGGTIGTGYAFYASQPTGTGAITTNYGMRITNQGRSGITTAYGLYLDAASGASSANYTLYSAGGTDYFGGNVGIGTTTPKFALDLQQAFAATAAAQIYNTSNTTNAAGLIVRLGFTTGGTPVTDAVTGNSFIRFLDANGVPQGSIDSIGSNAIAFKSAGADMAEYFRKSNAQENLPTGTLVCLANDGGVTQCGSGTNNIIGTVSTTAAFIGGSNHTGDANYVVVGMLGQLPVEVSSQNGTIQPGDPIAVSNIPGVGVKATKAGPIIGHATEVYVSSDPYIIGKVMAVIQPTWYDPAAEQVAIAADGTLSSVDMQTIPSSSPDTTQSVMGIASGQAPDEATLSARLDEIEQNVKDNTNKINSLQELENQTSSTAVMLSGLSSLVASSSATPSFAEISDVQIHAATIAANLQVLGRTTVSDLGVTGNITAGLLTINGLDNSLCKAGETTTGGSQDACTAGTSINTVGGPLALQSEGLAGISMEHGNVSIATNGDITTSGTITAKRININTSDATSATLGEATLPANQTTITINTTALDATSQIFITPKSDIDSPLFIDQQTPKTSFTVKITKSQAHDIIFSWWIVN